VRAAAITLVILLVAGMALASASEPAGEHHEPAKFLGLPAWIWKLINMLAFFGFLAWLIGGPVKRALASRQEQIQREAQEARERRAKADQMASDIQSRLKQIEEDIRSIRERAQVEGERQKLELIAAAEAEAQKILQNARNEVDNRIKHARHELTEYAGQLASERAERLLREKITDADREKLFRESLSQVEETRS
jgi:F-type H+-transporting ATPase subunit b